MAVLVVIREARKFFLAFVGTKRRFLDLYELGFFFFFFFFPRLLLILPRVCNLLFKMPRTSSPEKRGEKKKKKKKKAEASESCTRLSSRKW